MRVNNNSITYFGLYRMCRGPQVMITPFASRRALSLPSGLDTCSSALNELCYCINNMVGLYRGKTRLYIQLFIFSKVMMQESQLAAFSRQKFSKFLYKIAYQGGAKHIKISLITFYYMKNTNKNLLKNFYSDARLQYVSR